jgi:glycosyltransferase involved in cell wall biosynthesis
MKADHHILFVSSWWPTAQQSNGTFVELHTLGLEARGCTCAVLLTTESSLGQYLKGGLKENQIAQYRKHQNLKFIENPVVHKSLLRFSSDPQEKRKKTIIHQTIARISEYITRNGKPDFIFHHGVFNYTYLSEALATEFDLPIWYMENSPKISLSDIPTANPFVRQEDLVRFARNADRRFAVTEAYVEKMESVFGVHFDLCPNIITDDFFIEPVDRTAPEGYFQFVNVAILDERKNQQLLIRSFASNYAGNDHYRLVIAGDGKLYNDLKALAVELGVSNQVRITGFLSRSELVEVLDQSHCFVLTSKSETFGVVVIEAMARGIPAISSDIDGTREIINESNGMLFEEGSRESLCEVMTKMVDKYSTYQPSIIIQNVKQKYGPDASFKALFDGE